MINTTGCDNVLLVELDHGKVNALDLELLHEHIDAYGAAPANCPVVLTDARHAHVEVAGEQLRRLGRSVSGRLGIQCPRGTRFGPLGGMR